MAGQQPTYVDEFEVKFNTASQIAKVAGGGAVCLLLGGVAVFAGITQDFDRSSDRWVGIGLGAPVALVGIALLAALPNVCRHRGLYLSPTGIRYQDPKQRDWAVPWTAIGRVTLSTAYHRALRTGAEPNLLRLKTWRVRFAMDFSQPDVFDHQPALTPGRGRFGASKNGFGMSLANNKAVVKPLDLALRTYAGKRYHGVTEQGQTGGGYF